VSAFDLNINNMPGFVDNIVRDKAREAIDDVLAPEIQSLVPGVATDYLAEFLPDQYPVQMMGQTVHLAVTPTAMTWDASGGRIALSASAVVDGVEGASFLSNPAPAPTEMTDQGGLSIALADDMANQMFAGMWAAGALELVHVPAADDPMLGFFPEASEVQVQMLLPPVADADVAAGKVELTVGDAIVTVKRGDATLAKFAVFADIELGAGVKDDGSIAVTTGRPRVVAQVLEQAADLPVALDAANVAAFAEVAIKQFSREADGLFSKLPLPTMGGVQISEPTFAPRDGYVLVGGTIATTP
jgi:hypothetical protein